MVPWRRLVLSLAPPPQLVSRLFSAREGMFMAWRILRNLTLLRVVRYVLLHVWR